VLAMSCWLGGLVVLLALVLVRPAPAALRTTVERFSALALVCVSVLVVTGAFQTWRQVDSLSALRDTDFGRLLLAKLLVLAAMVVAAAFSREVVNRHFRDGGPPDAAEVDVEDAGVGGDVAARALVPAFVGGPDRDHAAVATTDVVSLDTGPVAE